MLLPCISDACLSIGSLKYMHHFGLDPFSNPGEHWILQASLAHSISDELFMRSFVSVLDASALASEGFRGSGFVAGKIGSIGTLSLIGFSRSKFPLSAHPARARARARSTANSPFIFAPVMQVQAHILPHHALDAGGKKNRLKMKVADLLILNGATKCPALDHEWTSSDVQTGCIVMQLAETSGFILAWSDWRNPPKPAHAAFSPRFCSDRRTSAGPALPDGHGSAGPANGRAGRA